MQEAYNALLAVLEEMETAKLLRAGLEEEEDEEMEEELTKREVIMGELLKMVLKLDYGDEIGRRKVFSVVSACFLDLLFFSFPGFKSLFAEDMLAHPQLPPSLIERCLDVLKEIMPSERDLIRVIVEIVVELREGEEDAENADEPPVRVILHCPVSSLIQFFVCYRSTTTSPTFLKQPFGGRERVGLGTARIYPLKNAFRRI